MHDYLDPALPPHQRADDLLRRMTVQEKAGLLFHPSTQPAESGGDFRQAHMDVVDRCISHFNVFGGDHSQQIAEWHNTLQEMAESTRLGIPVTISSDPRHGLRSNPFTGQATDSLSRWPEPPGIAAVRAPDAVRRYAETVRQEFLAMGVRVYLGPMADIFSEPRWSRGSGTFGEDPKRVAALTADFIEGLRGGAELGPQSVSAVVKHFPGAGPQLKGDDAHDARYKEQVYPGGQQQLHLEPFRAAFRAGTTQVMTYYGMPVGTDWDEVGFAFNRPVVQDLLRHQLEFDGIVLTDWNVIDSVEIEGMTFGPNGWGLESLLPIQRLRIALDVGIDQFGGDRAVELIEELVDDGSLPLDRLDQSVRRLLVEKFRLGVFEHRRVDAARAARICGSDEKRAAGLHAQRSSLVLLRDSQSGGLPPIRAGSRVFLDGLASSRTALEVVNDPESADAIVVRLDAPYEPGRGSLSDFFHGGTLDFPPAVVERLESYSEQAPVHIAVYLERPAVLTPLLPVATTLIGDFGAEDDVILDALTGATALDGRLPFDLPSSMHAVEQSREDVPFDTREPLFTAGFGLKRTTTSTERTRS